jgi:hypothetical protein
MDLAVQTIEVNPPTPEENAHDYYYRITSVNTIDQQFRLGYAQGMKHFAETHGLDYDWLK